MSGPTPSAPGALARLCERYVTLADRHTLKLLLVTALPVVAALFFAARLELRSDMADLLPDDHPVVVALHRTQPRQRSSTNLVVLIQSPEADANRRFAEALRPELERLVPSLFTEIDWRPDNDLPDFLAHWRWLYAELPDLQRAEELLDRLIASRTNPLAVDFVEDDPAAELRRLRGDLDKKQPARHDGDAFAYTENGESLRGIMLWRSGGGLASSTAAETLEAVRAAVVRTDPRRFHPSMRVMYTGAIGRSIDEHNAVRDDLTLSSALCGGAVLLVLWLYFRRAALIWVIGTPAVAGLLLALAIAQQTVHALNLNTSFLISIILGNGINAPIIVLARYGEERRAGAPVISALKTALTRTFVGTAAAMAAASVAYGSLLLTSFRGFSQFGLVGGMGMILVWVWTFLVVPPMVILGERLRPGSLTPPPNRLGDALRWIGRLGARRPWLLPAAVALMLGASALPLARWVRAPLEWDMHKLASTEGPWADAWRKMYHLGMGSVGAGHIGTDGVLLVDTPAQAEPVARALLEADRARGPEHVLRATRTIWSILPQDQEAKLEVLARLRRKIDRHLAVLDEVERTDVAQFRPPDDLRPCRIEDLPRRVRENFTEVDGTMGRLIGIDADTATYEDWNGHDLLRLERSMRVDALGKTWVASASSTVFAAMLEAMLRDGARVTLAAFVGVVLLVIIAFGVRGALPVISSVVLGVVCLCSALALLDLKINFANFIGIPITLGIGADYAANIWARLRAEGTARLADVLAETGSAVALCSSTTIIGYSSLLISSNRALRSFGVVADLGEVICLLVALVMLPALVLLRGKSR